MRTLYEAVLGLFLAFMLLNSARADRFPQLLPDAGSFQLTLREDPASLLPLGSSCGGEAGSTLACRAFLVTLKNVGGHTVHLSRIDCQEPFVRFERKEPHSTSGWWPVSQVSGFRCTPWKYVNLRLRPGETTEYSTRLVSRNRPADFALVTPGFYTLHARWLLAGCTEKPEGRDCLAPLQVLKASSWGGPATSDVDIQTSVEVISNEVEANSPSLPVLGPLILRFEISATPEQQAAEVRKRFNPACAADRGSSMECTVFHYAIRNMGNRPVRNGRYTCSDFSMIPEYRTAGRAWKQLQSRLMTCTANIYFETPIMPGAAAEGDFTLGALAPRFDTSPLVSAGKYQIRVAFHPNACFASPDGSFCLQSPKVQTAIISGVVSIQAKAFIATGPQ